MRPLLVLIAALCAFLAQPGPLSARKNVTYDSPHGFSVAPPQGWTRLGADVPMTQDLQTRLKSLGLNQPAKEAKEERFVRDTPQGEFIDNLGISVEPAVELDDAAVKQLRKQVATAYKQLFGNFRLVKFEKTTFGSYTGIHIEGEYRLAGFDVLMSQALITSKSRSLIMTCSVGRARQLEGREQCQKTFASVKIP